MCIVCTSRVGFRGQDGLDITVKSAQGIGQVLMPTWELVGGYKGWKDREPLSEQQYTDRYLELLRSRYRTDERPFIEILQRERVVLLCYCRTEVFCHRHLALTVLEKIAQAKGLPFVRGGELAAE